MNWLYITQNAIIVCS